MIPGQRKNYEKIPTIASLENYHYIAHVKRKQLIKEIAELLEGEQKRLYILFTFLILSIDRLVDHQVRSPNLVLSLKNFIKKIWEDSVVKPKDQYEGVALEFIEILKNLKKRGLKRAEYIYNDLALHLSNEYRNVVRRGQFLSEEELQEINEGAFEAALAAWFQLISFALTKEKAWRLAKLYALSSMMADDLVDIKEDLSIGFINVPKKDLKQLDINRKQLNKNYLLKKLQEIEKKFAKGDQILMSTLKELPEGDQKRINLLRDILYTWIEDVKSVYTSNKRSSGEKN